LVSVQFKIPKKCVDEMGGTAMTDEIKAFVEQTEAARKEKP